MNFFNKNLEYQWENFVTLIFPKILLKSRKLEIAFDLEKDTLYELFIKQNKKCFYSNLEMIHNTDYVKYNSISVDKKDPNKGYTKDNVVLCCNAINSFKAENNLEEFKKIIVEIIEPLKKFAESTK